MIIADNRLNKWQLVASAISGYEHFADYSSAKDDYFYELDTREAQIAHIAQYAQEVYNMQLTYFDCAKIYDFVTGTFDGTNARWHAFNELA